MKKVIIPILILIVMVAGCSNHDEEKDKQESKKEKTEQANKSNNKIKNSETFIEDVYTKDNIKEYRNVKDFVTKDKMRSVANQDQSYEDNHSKDVKKEVDKLNVYKPANTDKNEVLFTVHVKSINEKTKNVIFTENIGRIEFKKEDGKDKLNKFTQIAQREIYNSNE
ncbi:hypothetical protein H9S71_13700 [Staphylococcus aureus]|uniref:hypothetical protein n=1 Tax=Staphylococcus TaxID=1279 RepID=UPI0011225A7D|nr:MULTISPECIES: hypothetical protein [Staphylococcus]MBW5882122.1 hypothetical protein [Staphylococcus aureus]TOZ68306.1 hypothetical protein DJ442_12515 [Staphylococcus pseudintermedius]